MSPRKQPKNLAASVRQRLLNLAKDRKEEFQHVLSDYAVERLLYRLNNSRHAERFVLKGAMLLRILVPELLHRATWDLDLLGRGQNSVEAVAGVIRELCSGKCEDGLTYDIESVIGTEIRAADEYVGARIRLLAHLAGARIPMQIDVGFGDAVVPPARRETYPTLLDHPAPEILTYPAETVVAEKLQAMITLGLANSRMKDFYDVHLLASSRAFDGTLLAQAIRATFDRRDTQIPKTEPVALSQTFLEAPERRAQWRAFLRKSRLKTRLENAGDTMGLLRSFLIPILNALRDGDHFITTWPPGGPWREMQDRKTP